MKKKIIHIALGKANPERLNGVNKVINSLATNQVKEGCNVAFWGITLNPEHNFPTRNYSTHLFQDYRNKFRLDPCLKLALTKLDPLTTVIHLHGGFTPQLYSVSKILRKMKIPYFFSPHGAYNMEALKKSKWVKRTYIRLFERSLVNHSIGIQLLGISEKEGTDQYFNTPIYFIPNGQELNTNHFKASSQKEEITVGFIGRIDIHTKGLDLLLSGLKNTKITLEVIGSGGELAALKQLVVAEKLEQYVIFKGALFGEEKLEAIAQWDALCLVSRNEGLPGVVLEAASVGVPSIVTEQTNMGDYIESSQSGWLLNDYSTKALQDTFQKLILSKKSQMHPTYKNNAVQMIQDQFNWKAIVTKFNAIYA